MVEETAAVAAEEGEVAVAAEGVGGAFGYLAGLAEGAAALAPAAGKVAGTLAGAAGVGAAATAGLVVGIAGGAAYGLARGTGWVLRVQAQSNHTPRPFSWGLNPVTLPQSQPSSRASSASTQL